MATEREPDAPARRTKAETLRQIGDRLRQVNGDGPCNPPDLVLALDLLIDAHNEALRECETLRAAVAYRPVAAGVSANPLARLKSIATQIIRQIDLLAMPLCADQQEGMSRATRTLVATLIAEMEADGEVPAASARQVERRAVVILADLQRGAAPTPGREAKMDHHIEREDNAGGCRPGGPYCPGMNAALDAAAKGGLAAGSLLKIGGAAEPPEVIIHRGVINGERRQLLLQCCPFCRAELEPRRTLVAAAPAAEGTVLASETELVPVAVDCCDLHRSFPNNPGSCLNRPPGEAPRAVIFGEVLLGRGPAIAQARAEALIAAQRASIAPQSPVAAPEGAALTEHGVDARLKQD